MTPDRQRPEWSVAFDDAGAAVATRRRTFDTAAADRLLIAGMHLDFPAFGHVQLGRDGQPYRFVPIAWQTAFPVFQP